MFAALEFRDIFLYRLGNCRGDILQSLVHEDTTFGARAISQSLFVTHTSADPYYGNFVSEGNWIDAKR